MNETNTFEELIVMRSKSGDGTIYRQRPLVRCKDCKHFEPDGVYTMCYRHNGLSQGADWFCADGERKD